MASAVNAALFGSACAFLLLTYLTDWALNALTADAPSEVLIGQRRTHKAAKIATGVALIMAMIHIFATGVFTAGAWASYAGAAVAAILLTVVLTLIIRYWRIR